MDLKPEKRIAGVLAPLFALRSDNDLGVGDVNALRLFVDWAAQVGFRLVQLLPINETGADNSPYMAVSSMALDPTGLDVSPSALQDLTKKEYEATLATVNLPALRHGPVKYKAVKPLKLKLLELAFNRFESKGSGKGTPRGKRYQEFLTTHAGWLEAYAFFRTLMDLNDGSEKWDDWPKSQQSLKSARKWFTKLRAPQKAEFERKLRFYQYVQWIAFTQWKEIKKHCDKIGVALMGDVPFGLSYYSADVWANPEVFDLTWSGGAPPEPLFQDDAFTQKWGQNWGVPLYNWSAMHRDDFAWWRRRVRTVREFFHLFRIDHVLGFYRIYAFPWRPQRNGEFLPLTKEEAALQTGGRLPGFIEHDDSTAENRAANCAQGERFLKVLLEEVGHYRLIGEDLGVVPPYVRPNLTNLDIAGFKIPAWESEPDGSLTPYDQYPPLSVTTFGTHDHEPLRAMWERWGRKFAANERGEPGAAAPAWHAGEEMRHLMRWARIYEDQPIYTDFAHEALIAALFNSPSWIAVLMITDLFGSTQRFNVPGAIADSNWSERLDSVPAYWMEHAETATKLARVRELIQRSGR